MRRMKKKISCTLFICMCVITYLFFFTMDFKNIQNLQLATNLSPISPMNQFKTIKKDNKITTENHFNQNQEFYLNPEDLICGNSIDSKITFITIVVIEPQNVEKRNLIRQTYGSKNINSDFRVIFVVGMSENNTVNRLLVEEFSSYKDIIQINNFIDSRNNLTTKIMMSFYWVSKYCANSKFLLRVNDEIFVNPFALLYHFKSLKAEKKIFGYGIYGVGPNRDMRSKFYVSESEYSKSQYNDFIEGSAYIITTDMVEKYYNKSQHFHIPPFSTRLENIYIGMIAEFFKTPIVDIKKYFVPSNQQQKYAKKEKCYMISQKGIENTFFIYESFEFLFYWNLTVTTFKSNDLI